MKRGVLICLTLFLIFNVSAISITEVELNPEGSDSGNEWIEFSSFDPVNLSNYSIQNNDGEVIDLAGDFTGYWVYPLPSQWLDNSDEKVFLYFEGDLIDETDLLEDSDNDNQTWQLCDSSWDFLESTKEFENICSTQNPPAPTNFTNQTNTTITPISTNNLEEQEEPEEEVLIEEPIISPTNNVQDNKNKEPSAISLKSNLPEQEDTKPLKNKDYSPYYLLTFCGLLVFLYLLRENKNKKSKKNEFR